MKAQFLPLFNVNLSQLQLNLNSIQLNFNSASSQPHFNLKLNSTTTLTQYGCDIKATQSCYISQSQILIPNPNFQFDLAVTQ